ncbi:ROK family transcriptional regulator [uncultured Roseobacter sp.]|uniref:ROK family transcriptional regulator n=1 Tax=uncultured Roseobacter sp. TaxID=114847 RepID=UPI002609C760|nr:ROK family transcriptional regulator [uncultured Roseobacter sp.]
MDGQELAGLSSGVNQRGVRNYNERLLLSMFMRHGPMPGSDLARKAGLSPQTVSVILRKLERDGLLVRGAPQRGRVGKPSVPMDLAPEGVFSFGLKIGRRSAELLLLSLSGTVIGQLHLSYRAPDPAEVFGFLADGMSQLLNALSPAQQARLCGIGLASPFELWKWRTQSGPATDDFSQWQNVDFAAEIARFSPLPLFMCNDATAACRAEHLYGLGKKFRDHAYFYIGSFIGGGVVLNHTVFEGNQGNAGALGSLRTTGPLGESQQLIDVASLHLLEARLIEVGLDPKQLWHLPQDWTAISRYVDPWIGETAQELAKASLSICSVVDFEAILIDGAFPDPVRAELVDRVRRYLATQDTRGLLPPKIEAGAIGFHARAIGAASGPIFAQFFLNMNAGLAAV